MIKNRDYIAIMKGQKNMNPCGKCRHFYQIDKYFSQCRKEFPGLYVLSYTVKNKCKAFNQKIEWQIKIIE